MQFADPKNEKNMADHKPAFVCPRCKLPRWNHEQARHGWCEDCEDYTGPPETGNEPLSEPDDTDILPNGRMLAAASLVK
jgi:hypothetical protein